MTASATPPKQENPWLNLLFNIVLPTLILTQLSGQPTEDGGLRNLLRWGPKWPLVLGCALPIGYGLYDYRKSGKINFFSVLGLIAVLSKGLLGLAEAQPIWIACSEAALPIIFGLAILWTTRWDPPLVQRFLLSPQLFDVEKLNHHLEAKKNVDKLRPLMVTTSYGYAGTMVISAILNFTLALAVLKAEPGTEAFTAQLGKFTGLQYPVIAMPQMLVTFGLLYYVMRRLGQLTGVPAWHFVPGYEEEEEKAKTKEKEQQPEA